MIEVKFKGYVNGVRTFDWGTVYNISHNQVRKNHQGEWETVGRDYFSVVGPAGFDEGDQVEVTGKMKSKTYEKKDGSGKGISLEVRADTMTRVERGAQQASPGRNAHVNPTHQGVLNSVWPEAKSFDENAPF